MLVLKVLLAPLVVVLSSLAGRRWGPRLAGILVVLLVDLGLAQLRVPAGAAALLALLSLVLAALVLRRLNAPTGPITVLPWWDLPARALATGALVVLLTSLASSLGPTWTGVLTPFPIALSVVCAFAAAHDGHSGVLALLRGIVPGLGGFVLFCFLVAVTIDRIAGAASFVLATAAAVGFAVALVLLRPQGGA